MSCIACQVLAEGHLISETNRYKILKHSGIYYAIWLGHTSMVDIKTCKRVVHDMCARFKQIVDTQIRPKKAVHELYTAPHLYYAAIVKE